MKNPRSVRDAALPFLEAVIATPLAVSQARLLNTTDRDLGAVLHALEEEERARVYNIVGEAKALRLREEVARMSRVALDPATIGAIASHLAAHLTGNRPRGPASKYFRPRKQE